MWYLTFANTFGILKSSDVGFASITFRVQECPGRVTVPDDSVVYEVRLISPIKFQLEQESNKEWSCRIEFVET